MHVTFIKLNVEMSCKMTIDMRTLPYYLLHNAVFSIPCALDDVFE